MTSRQVEAPGVYYEDAEVAELLGISVGRLCNKLTAGSPLPPRIQPPGSRLSLVKTRLLVETTNYRQPGFR